MLMSYSREEFVREYVNAWSEDGAWAHDARTLSRGAVNAFGSGREE